MRELSIIVPVYNEERTIAELMRRLQEVCTEAEHIYVDDGSRDGSRKILHAHARDSDRVLTKENGGKGSAIRMGLQEATGLYTVIQDADLEYDPHEIALLLQEAKGHPQAVIFGSRFLRDNPNIYKRYLLGNKILTGILNLLFGATLTDSYTCYKLLPTILFRALNLQSRGFEMEAEIAAKCLKKKIDIREVPISYRPRTLKEGKKIGWQDAWKGLCTMTKIRFTHLS